MLSEMKQTIPLSKVNGYGWIRHFPYSLSRVSQDGSSRDSTNNSLDFRPPRNPESMKALLQQSVQNFGPLPSELRPRRRSRTFSRPSPYPLARVGRVFYAPESKLDSPPTGDRIGNGLLSQAPAVLQDVHTNSNVPPSPAPSFTFKAFSPEKETLKQLSPLGRPAVRPRVGSTARRVAKRNTKSCNADQKENKENKENVSTGSVKRYVISHSKASSTNMAFYPAWEILFD